jgi:tRNA 2-thiouridine synthesizing protein A
MTHHPERPDHGARPRTPDAKLPHVRQTGRPGTDNSPGTDHPGTDSRRTDHPGTDSPRTDHPGIHHPGTDHPGTHSPASDRPGTGATRIVDSRGRRCPLPVIDLARVFGEVPVAGTITLWADDPAAGADVAAWCRMRGQELAASAPLPDGGDSFVIRRLA